MGSKHVRKVNKGFNVSVITYRNELWWWNWDVKKFQSNVDRIAEYKSRLKFRHSPELIAFYEIRIEEAVKENEVLKEKWPKYLM